MQPERNTLLGAAQKGIRRGGGEEAFATLVLFHLVWSVSGLEEKKPPLALIVADGEE